MIKASEIYFLSTKNKQVILAGSAYWTCEDGSCGSCATSILQMKENEEATYGDLLEEYTILRDDFGSTKLDRSLARISCHSTEQMWFDIMRSYGDVGRFLSVFSLFGIVLYFVTSSDSGSLVIDCLSANGICFILALWFGLQILKVLFFLWGQFHQPFGAKCK